MAEKTFNPDDPKWGRVTNRTARILGNAIVRRAGEPDMGDHREKTGEESLSGGPGFRGVGRIHGGVQLMILVQRPKRIAKVEMDTGESNRAFEIARQRLRHPQLVEEKGEDVCIFRDAFGEGGAHAVARG